MHRTGPHRRHERRGRRHLIRIPRWGEREMRLRSAAALTIVGAVLLVGANVPGNVQSATLDSVTHSPDAGPPSFAVPDPRIPVRGELIAPQDADSAIDVALEPHYVAFADIPRP